MSQTYSVDVRCPNGFHRLFMVLHLAGGTPTITDDNLMEFACGDCKRALKKQGFEVLRVLHQYNFLGEFQTTYFERDEDEKA